MQTVRNSARAAGLFGLALAVTFLAVSCGRKEVSARAQPPKVTKWKCHPQHEMGIPKGIIVEQQGGVIRARFCDLKPGVAFEVNSTLSHGTFFPDRKLIIFPLGMPEVATPEEWVQAGGPHLSVPFDAKASRLLGDLASSGATQSFEFLRLQ